MKRFLIGMLALGVVMFVINSVTTTIKSFFLFTFWTVAIVAAFVFVCWLVRRFRKWRRLRKLERK